MVPAAAAAPCAGDVAARAHHSGRAARCEDDRQLELGSKDRDADVDAARVDPAPRSKRHRFERSTVRLDGELAFSSTVDVVEHELREASTCLVPVVLDRQH